MAGLSIAIAAVVILCVVSLAFSDTANSIDTVHWVGEPLPPCFINAAKCGGHVLGTDEVGRDMVARLLVGTRTTLLVSASALVCEFLIAFGITLLARCRPLSRSVVSRIAAAISSIPPWPYIAIIAMFSFRAKVEPLVGGLWLALWAGIVCWPALWRRMTTSFSPRPIVKNVLREWSTLILVFVTIDFFGYGIQPPLASLGNMLAFMQAILPTHWFVATLPALCIFLLVLTIELARRVGCTSSDEACEVTQVRADT